MTRHLVRLLWNRRRHNALLVLEILCSFVVLFAVLLAVLQYGANYRLPLGFDIARTWAITASSNGVDGAPEGQPAPNASLRDLVAALQDLPQVEAAAAAFAAPYESSSYTDVLVTGGQPIDYEVNEVTDGFARVMGLRIVDGRWFGREDDGAAWRPVVISASFARTLFGDVHASGRSLPRKTEAEVRGMPDDMRAEALREQRVIGVVDAFRQHGELSSPGHYLFRRVSLEGPIAANLRTLLVKLRPGVGAAFEEPLVRRLRAAAPGWSFDVQTGEQMRERTLRFYATPVAALSIIAAFLLGMVALGLTGVVWQNVTQRTREIGLRRAKGATRRGVSAQLLAELAVLTGAAVALGLLLVAQLPLLPLPRELQLISAQVFAGAAAISVASMFALTLSAGWYPTRMAGTIQPADALRYE